MLTAAFKPEPFYENIDNPIGPLFTLGLAACAIGTAVKYKSERYGSGMVALGPLSCVSAALHLLSKVWMDDTIVDDSHTRILATSLYGACAATGIVSTGLEAHRVSRFTLR